MNRFFAFAILFLFPFGLTAQSNHLIVPSSWDKYAQDNVVSELISTSTAREFLLSKKFKTKEYYELGRAKDLIFNALIITDVLSGEKIGCVQLVMEPSIVVLSRYPDRGVLDFDELDDCISYLDYVIDNLLPTAPAFHKEAVYRSRDNVTFCAANIFNTNLRTKVWALTLGTYSNKSEFVSDPINNYFDEKYIKQFRDILVKAKEVISEKLGASR